MDQEKVKNDLHNFRRWVGRNPLFLNPAYVWKMEFTKRGYVHYHLILVNDRKINSEDLFKLRSSKEAERAYIGRRTKSISIGLIYRLGGLNRLAQ